MRRFLLFLTALALGALAVITPAADAQVCGPLDDGRLADVAYEGTTIFWDAIVEYQEMVLTIGGPCEDVVRVFPRGESISFDIREITRVTDGTYTWQLRRTASIDPGVQEKLLAARGSGKADELWWYYFEKGSIPEGPYVESGTFTVAGGLIVDPGQTEDKQGPIGAKSGAALAAAGRPATDGAAGVNLIGARDQVIPDDLIVQASLCVGFDCVNGESFSFDTIRLKENNLRIKFQDTSTLAGFPTTDWELTANDSASGGQNRFSITDVTASRTPFTVEGGATSNSIYVDSTGRVGFRTSTPVLDLHISTSNTPGLRLEQTSAGGFTAQTWDIAGNESNFFVRDVTGGSRLPLRIRPGAPTSSIDISNDGDVGFGTTSPDSAIHVSRSSASFVAGLNLENSGGDVGFRLSNDHDVVDLNLVESGGANEFRVNFGASPAELTLQADGDLIITGTYTPDYVFEADYPLLSLPELKAFIAENGHLPNVPSDAEVKRTGRINLSEFQLRLLEKIEELTLYTLEQHDHIGTLRGELEAKDVSILELQTRNAELESRQDGFTRELETLQEAVAALQQQF